MPKIFCLLLVVLFIFSVTQVNALDRWILILDSGQAKHYFDVDSIKVLSDNDQDRIYLDVWIKVSYNGTGKNAYRESLRKAEIPTQGYEDFSYAINHLLFEDGRVCLLGVYDYNNTGVILRSFDAPVRHWLDIVPGSTIEVWYQQVMAFAAANMKMIIERMRDCPGENRASHHFI